MNNAVITGASKGIGRALAQRFAQAGFSLAICSRNKREIEAFANELRAEYGIKVLATVCDVSRREDLIEFSDMIRKEWKKVDVLINNAGFFQPGAIRDEEEGVLRSMTETNVYSAYDLSRLLLPMLDKSEKAHLFNMCSTASLIAYPNGGSYCITKFALYGMTKVLREELKEDNIKVSAVMPGPTFSASWQGVDIPEERFMKASEVANTIWSAYQLEGNAVVEDIVMRPQLGDL